MRFLFLFTASLLVGFTAFAQNPLPPRFANAQALQQQIDQLLTQRQQIDLLAPFAQTELSTSARHLLRLAAATVETQQAASLSKTMIQIEQYRDLSEVNKDQVRAGEEKYIRLSQEIERLRRLQASLQDSPKTNSANAAEIAFYQLSSQMTIAEIGAGDQHFAQQLITTVNPVKYFINDIDSLAIQTISDYFHLRPHETMVLPFLGASRSTKLEGKKIDALIIRNALHHFDQLPEMLSSIHSSLATDGRLLLKETFTEHCYGRCCPDIRAEAELLPALEKAGFELRQREIIREESVTWHLLEYSTQKKSQY